MKVSSENKDMLVRVFTIRVNHSETKKDERKVNKFLKKVRVKYSNVNLVNEDTPYYAYSFRYVEKHNEDDE